MKSVLLLAAGVAALLLAGCGGSGSPSDSGTTPVAAPTSPSQPTTPKENTQQQVFTGEHENLRDGDTADFRAGLHVTLSDFHLWLDPRISKDLLVVRMRATNDGRQTFDFKGGYPCGAYDKNGVPLTQPSGSGISPETKSTVGQFATAIEPGQERDAYVDFAMPDDGSAFEIRCTLVGTVGFPNIPPTGRATWPVDPATLQRR